MPHSFPNWRASPTLREGSRWCCRGWWLPIVRVLAHGLVPLRRCGHASLMASSSPTPSLAVLQTAARVLVAAGQPAEAERALRQVLVLAPDNLVAASMLARLLLGANRVMEVGSLLEPLFRNGRANPEILMLYG